MSAELKQFHMMVAESITWLDDNQQRVLSLTGKFQELLEVSERLKAERDSWKNLYDRVADDNSETLLADIADLKRRLSDSRQEAEKEKLRRIHWQNLAYAGMRAVDRVNGRGIGRDGGCTEETFLDEAERAGKKFQSERLRSVNALTLKESLDYLREDEGDSVTLYNDNPEFDGPAAKISCCGAWTGWVDREFTGDTFAAAVFAADAAKRNLDPADYPPPQPPTVSTEIQPFSFAGCVFDVAKILQGVILNAELAADHRGRYLWGELADRTGLGSTSAKKLCLALGYDPDTGQKLAEPTLNEESDDQTQQNDGTAS